MKRSLVFAAAILAACGPATSRYEQQQQPVTPTGTIYVRVLDGNTLSPLPGVSAKVLGVDGADGSLTGGADGVIVLKNAVVLSGYTFILESAGYVRQLVTMTLPGTTGNSPLQNPIATTTVTLYKADGEIKGVLLLPDGKPAASATVYVDQSRSGAGESVVSATTGADGTFDLKGLATRTTGISHTVVAQWFDENGDGEPDYSAFGQNVWVYTGSVARLFMKYTALTQQIVATNIADAELPPGEDIKFTFALPILASNLDGTAGRAFVLTNQSRGSVEVATETTYAADGVNVSIKPAGGLQLTSGDQYRIAINVTQAGAGSSNANANFSTSYTFQVRPTGVTPITTQVTGFTVTNPNPSTTIGANQFNYDSNSFLLAWDGVPGILKYNVYAKDTTLNPGWVLLNVSPVSSGAARVQVTVNLPASFDQYSFNGTTQPLANKNKVTFAVVPVDAYGNWSPLGNAPTQQVEDNVPPTTAASNPFVVVTPYGLNYPQSNYVDAINDDTTKTSTLQFRLTYSEPMDPTSQPTFAGSTAITTSFAWEGSSSGTTSGILTLTISPGGDGSGPFVIRGGKDVNGNLLMGNDITGSLSGMKDLLLANSGNFEDASGTCTMNGWTPSHTSSMPDPVLVTGSSRVGKCAAFVGSPAGTAAAMGSSKISQDVTLPTFPANTRWSLYFHAAYRDVYQQPSTGTVSLHQWCHVTTTTDADVMSSNSSYNDNMSSYLLDWTSMAGTSVNASFPGGVARVVCEANNSSTTNLVNGGLYVDDVSLMLFKPGTI